MNVFDTTDVPYMDSMDFSSTPRVQYLTEFRALILNFSGGQMESLTCRCGNIRAQARAPTTTDVFKAIAEERGREIIGVLNDGREWRATMSWRERWRQCRVGHDAGLTP